MDADNQRQIELISGQIGQKKSALIGVNLRLIAPNALRHALYFLLLIAKRQATSEGFGRKLSRTETRSPMERESHHKHTFCKSAVKTLWLDYPLSLVMNEQDNPRYQSNPERI